MNLEFKVLLLNVTIILLGVPQKLFRIASLVTYPTHYSFNQTHDITLPQLLIHQ